MPWPNQSPRRAQLPPDWHKRRARTWRTAGGQCQWVTNGQRCTWTGRLNGDNGQCDHIDNPHDHDRLQWLCPTHHKQKTALEAAAPRTRHPRPTEQHPGRITPQRVGGTPAPNNTPDRNV